MKNTLLVAVYIVNTIFANAQSTQFEWAKGFGGSWDNFGTSIKSDVLGNVYITGFFEGTADFDPGVGTVNLTSLGGRDIFILKLDAGGNLVWAKAIGGAASDGANAIVLDDLNNVYVTGGFSETVDFDPGVGVVNLTVAGEHDAFILKLNAAGNFEWVKTLGGPLSDGAGSITLDKFGNILITGIYTATVDFDPGVGIFNLTALGEDNHKYEDIFILKLNASGNFIWAKSMGGKTYDWPMSFAVDLYGNVYTTGVFSSTGDFDPGIGGVYLTSEGTADIFISKLNVNGDFVWAKSIGGTSGDYGNSIAVDSQCNVYTTGNFSGIADFDPDEGVTNLTPAGSDDIFISKLDSLGNYVWAKRFGATFNDAGQGITLDAKGNVYTVGWFAGTVDFDPGIGTFNLISASNDEYGEIFISKLDGNGKFIWAKSMGSITGDMGKAITVDFSNTVFTTGSFSGTADFDPGIGVFNLISHSQSVFVHKMSQTIISDIKDNISATTQIVYPNPTSGIFNIVIPLPINNGVIEIYNTLGNLVYKQVGIKELEPITLVDQSKGLYFLKITDHNQILATQKIVKQ